MPAPQIKIDASGLHPKQLLALQSLATEILYGGAAGGGKSHLMRAAAIITSCEIPGLQTYIFRRNYPDLLKNHIEGPKGLRAILADMERRGLVRFREGNTEIRFWNGSTIFLCHCQNDDDMYKYQGAEIHQLFVDELTHFSERVYRFLRGRVRLAGLTLPEHYKGRFPRIIVGSNPGGVGHAWVKQAFISAAEPLIAWRTPKAEGGMLRQYIPARLEDNPSLLVDDPDYADRLEGLGSPELVRAMREGDWDIASGAALELLSRDKHMLRPFMPPKHWLRFMAMDWGSAHPYSVGWYCVAEGNTGLAAKDGYPERVIPSGAVVRYRELYGWGGKADTGTREDGGEVVRKILAIEQEAGERIDYRVGDSAMWQSDGGPSIEERMYTASGGKFLMERSRKDRIANYHEIRSRLRGEEGRPMFYVTANCQHFWRTVPDLVLDERQPEKGPDTRQEDHVYDEVAYALASRPFVVTRQDRMEQARQETRAALEAKREMLNVTDIYRHGHA